MRYHLQRIECVLDTFGVIGQINREGKKEGKDFGQLLNQVLRDNSKII